MGADDSRSRVAEAEFVQAMETYLSGSSRTTWMFPPIGKYLAQ